MVQVQMEDMNSQAQLSAAQQLANTGAGAQNLDTSGITDAGDDDDDIPELEAVDDDGPIDESGIDAKDIDLVMAQVRYRVLFANLLSHRCAGELHKSQGRSCSERE
jgi:NACalpha-BTF3-like transcription factor